MHFPLVFTRRKFADAGWKKRRKENLSALFHPNEYSKYLSGGVNKAVNATVSCLDCSAQNALFCSGSVTAVTIVWFFTCIYRCNRLLLGDMIVLGFCLERVIDVIISNIRLHNIRLQLGPYYEYREGQMTHKTACNIITVDSTEDKNPWKKNYVIKCMSQKQRVVVLCAGEPI